MELLIFVKHRWADFNGHWMDQPGKYTERKDVLLARTPPEKHAEFLVKAQREFDAKTVYGDIIEIHEDGWWENIATKNHKGNMADCFACIQITGMPVEKKYGERIKDQNGHVVKANRFRILSGFQLGQLTKVSNLKDVNFEDKITCDLKTK